MKNEFSLLRDAVYELVFLLSQGNELISYLGMISIGVDYVQILSFSFSTEDLLNWSFPLLQRGLFMAVAPWPINTTTFYVAFSLAVTLLLLLLVLFYQVYVTRGVRSVYILQGGRILISLFGTVLFFPMVETCVSYLKKLIFSGLLKHQIPIDADLYKNLALAVLALVLFILPVTLFTYLCFSPDPLDNQDALAKITTRPEIMDLLGRGIIVLNSNFTIQTTLRVLIHFFIVLAICVLHILYPSYVNPKLSYLRAFLICSVLWVSAIAIAVGSTPQKDPMLAIMALLGIPVCGLLGVACLRLKFESLNIIKWLDTSVHVYRGFSPTEKQLKFLRQSVEHFIETKCFLSTDIEVASRFCEKIEDHLVGRILFEKGIDLFSQSPFLKCRYAMYLVYVTSPGKELAPKEKRKGAQGGMKHYSFASPKRRSHGDHHKHTVILTETQRLGLIGGLIQSTLNTTLPLDLQYIFFYLTTQSEQQLRASEAGELQLTLLDSVRFKSDFSMATRSHRLVLLMLQEFWQYVNLERLGHTSSDNQERQEFVTADSRVIGQIARMCDDFYEHCRIADTYYQKLLDKFPTSDLVAERYAMLLSSVMNDEKASNDVIQRLELAKKERRKFVNASHLQNLDGLDASRISSFGDFEMTPLHRRGSVTFGGNRSFRSSVVRGCLLAHMNIDN
jgi:hypothetical protein